MSIINSAIKKRTKYGCFKVTVNVQTVQRLSEDCTAYNKAIHCSRGLTMCIRRKCHEQTRGAGYSYRRHETSHLVLLRSKY